MLGTPFGGVTGFTHRRRASLTWRQGGIVHRPCPGPDRGGPWGRKIALSDFTNGDYAGYVIVLLAPAEGQNVGQ